MSTRKNFFLGAATGVMGLGIKTLLNIVVYPVILQKLGVERYGLYVLLLNLADLLVLMDLGLTSGMIQRLTSLRAKDQEIEARKVLSAGFFLYLALAVGLFSIGFFILPGLPQFFKLSPELSQIALACLYLILTEASMTLFQGYFGSVLMSHALYQWVNTSESLYFILANGGIFVLLGMGYGLKEMLALRLVAAICKFSLICFHAIRIDKHCIQPYYFNVSKMIDLLKVSFHAMIRTVSDIFANRMDLVIIARFLDMRSVAMFEFVFRFLNIIMQVPFHLATAIFPIFTKLSAQNDMTQSRFVFLRISNFILFIVSILIAILWAFYPAIFHFFSGGQMHYKETVPLLAFAIPGIISYAISMPANHYLYGAEHFKLITISSTLSAALKIVLALILIHPFGLLGIIIAGLVMDAVQHQFLLIRKTCEILSINFKTYVYDTYLVNIPALVIGIGIIYGIKTLPFLQSCHIILQLVIVTTATLVASLAVWFLTTSTQIEKKTVREFYKAGFKGLFGKGNIAKETTY
jgi:O-antigen/teichoic acid export membrane protein